MKKIILSCFMFSSFISFSAMAELKVDLLNEKVTRIENDLSALQRKVYQTKEVPILLPAENNLPVVDGNLEDLYSRISAQDQVVKDLTAKM
ncbi:MAG: hypothetical protein IKL33_00940, partial [Alphaproteobacteria bacterium]|nr:hypothetical protein [Alphaproteobacteria bacterium]